MSENLNLAQYSADHRARERGHENGYVDIAGKRVKKWRGWYHVYAKSAAGAETRIKRKRIIGECSKMSKAEAREEHRSWIRRFCSQPVADAGTCRVADLCDDYLQMRQGDWEESTRKTIRSLFEGIIKPAIGGRAIETVTADELKRFINALPNRTWTSAGRIARRDGKLEKIPGVTKSGISHSYLKKAITMLRAVFDLAQERDLITKNPARSINIRLSMPKQVRRPDKSVLPPQHLPALLAELTERDRLIVWISMLGATRPGELFAIKGGDVGPDWVHVERALNRRREFKETKTGNSRYVHLPPETANELHQWMTQGGIGPNDLVFPNRDGKPIDRANFLNRRLRPAAKRARIPVADVDFQMLRRSFATVAQVVGFDVKGIQAQLGHSRPDMSATEYMQPIDARRVAQMKQLEDMLRGRVKMPVDISARLGSTMVQ